MAGLDYVPATVPMAGQVLSVVLQMATFGVLCVCFTRRTVWIKNWRNLPLAIWLILMIYVDSTVFVLATSIIVHGLGINSSKEVCEGGILLCLVCYMTTKILIYYFLVERAYIVRASLKPRHNTKLWLFNCIFMLLPYTIFVIMNFVWRINYINKDGVCIIGMQKKAMLPLICFEVVVNVYLTLLFVLPLRNLYSYKNNANPKLNRMAFRSFIGSCATLTTSVANLTVLMVLKGEPGWICLMCCNADILFCVLVLHWVTSHDRPTTHPSTADETNRRRTAGTLSLATDKATVDRSSMAPGLATVDRKIWPYSEPVEDPNTSITTECVSEPLDRGRRVLHKNSTVWEGEEGGDEVELKKIHVRTCQTMEVEEGNISRSGSGSGSEDDHWGENGTSVEKIV